MSDSEELHELQNVDQANLQEVLDTDSGRKPIWGIIAGLAFSALAIFAIWRVTAGDSRDANRSPSSPAAAATTAANATVREASGQRSSVGANVFFFALAGSMIVVAVCIVWRVRRIPRLPSGKAP